MLHTLSGGFHEIWKTEHVNILERTCTYSCTAYCARGDWPIARERLGADAATHVLTSCTRRMAHTIKRAHPEPLGPRPLWVTPLNTA